MNGIDGAQPGLDRTSGFVAVGAGPCEGPTEDADVRMRVHQGGNVDFTRQVHDFRLRGYANFAFVPDLQNLTRLHHHDAARDDGTGSRMDACADVGHRIVARLIDAGLAARLRLAARRL